MKKQLGILLALVGGCTIHQTAPLSRGCDVAIYPVFPTAGQAILNPNTLASIATLDIVPYIETTPNTYWPINSTTGNPTIDTDPNRLKLSQTGPIDPSRPFVLRNLKNNAKYRVLGQAYNSGGSKISLDASSSVDLTLTNDDRPAMANLPVALTNTPFAASTSVIIKSEGRFDYLKAYLYLQSGGASLMSLQTVREDAVLGFSNLQGNTNYRVVAEAYKLGQMMASNSVDLVISNDTAPSTTDLALTIPYVVTTLAGNGVASSSDGVGTSASFNQPLGITHDDYGNLYIGDYNACKVRKISPSGVVTTIAGNGTASSVDGTGINASFYGPIGVTLDPSGNLFVGEYSANKIRKIAPDATVTTFAGSGATAFLDQTGTSACFNRPFSLIFDSIGNLFVADQVNQRIRKITPAGVVTTFAGNGTAGLVDGTGTAASFRSPTGISIDSNGNLYVGDLGNHCVRKITPAGVVTTFAGNGTSGGTDGLGSNATFNSPAGVTVDKKGNVYVAEHAGCRLRKVSPSGLVTTLAGNGIAGSANGTGTAATFNLLGDVTIDNQGYIYVVDRTNNLVRKLQ